MGEDQVMISKRIKVKGRVQGVYFRASAKQKAQMLGLKGSVKNLDDGSVCLEVEGEESSVMEMQEWCKHGPALARVDKLEIDSIQPLDLQGFDIKH